jgi:hypothetical protein
MLRTVFDGNAIEENTFLSDFGESDMNEVRLTVAEVVHPQLAQ